MNRPDRLWRVTLLAVVTPVLVGGFSVSALANRWIFAVWALAVAVGSALALRRGFEVWWGRPAAGRRIAVRVLAILAPATFVLARLVARHQEIFDLGLRAVWPGLYTPVATAPATYLVVAGILTVAGILIASTGWVGFPATRSGRPDSMSSE
jgi:hypothetical protein